MQKPIRVLCVFSTLDRGGAESMCMNLYRHIDRNKVQFDFVKHTKQKGAFEEEIVSLGGIIHTAPRLTLKSIMYYRKWWNDFLKLHPEYSIIHGHYFTISAVYFAIAKKNNRITIAHSHIAKFDSIRKRILCRNIEEYSDYCFACGREAGKLLFPSRHFIVLNNAVDAYLFRYNEDTRHYYRKKMGIEDKIVVGIVANFGKHKNPLGVIDLFNRLSAENDKYLLIWVGRDAGYLKPVKKKIEEYGIQDKVRLLGVRDDVNCLMQAMDLFVLPSFYEGLPVVLIEAQAAGLKCFISDQVTKEVDITGRCEFISLASFDKWIRKIEKADIDHVDTYKSIIDHNYDISHSALWLQEFYLKIAQNYDNV